MRQKTFKSLTRELAFLYGVLALADFVLAFGEKSWFTFGIGAVMVFAAFDAYHTEQKP